MPSYDTDVHAPSSAELGSDFVGTERGAGERGIWIGRDYHASLVHTESPAQTATLTATAPSNEGGRVWRLERGTAVAFKWQLNGSGSNETQGTGTRCLSSSMPAGQAIELFPVPMPWFQPYMAQNDDAGYVWTGSISADHVARMNEETGGWNFYLLPAEANIRHIHVQRSEIGGLSSSWVGMNHQGWIVHIEPLAR